MSRETTALVVKQIKGAFSLEAVKLDALRSDEALIEIHATGICHTDLSCATGVLPAKFPAVFGHEGAGIVIETGSKVSDVNAGDKVLLSYAFCDECSECASGHPPYCEEIMALNMSGQRRDGSTALSLGDGTKLHGHFFGQSSFSRLAVVNRSCLVKVPQDIPLSLFAPLGCGLQTGAGAVLNTLNVQPDSTVAIFGVGSVGLSAIMASRIRGAKEIIAVDIQASRLDLAKELGATITINGKEVYNVVDEIRKICPPRGVKYALDCSGELSVIEQMIESLGTRGRGCSVGAPTPGKRVSVDVFSHLALGREYVGCSEGESIAREMAPYLIEQHSKGNYPLEKIITNYDFRDFATALTDVKEGRTIKAVLNWSDL